MHKVFVYGTLKRGYPNHGFMSDDARFLGDFQTRERFPLVIGGSWFTPYLFDEPGVGELVKGEIFEVGDTELAVLDNLESIGKPLGYHRRKIPVEKSNSDVALEAWTYLMLRERVSIIHSEKYLVEYPNDPRYVVPSKR